MKARERKIEENIHSMDAGGAAALEQKFASTIHEKYVFSFHTLAAAVLWHHCTVAFVLAIYRNEQAQIRHSAPLVHAV